MESVLKYIGMKDIDLSIYNINNYKKYCEPFGGSFNTGFKLIEQGYEGKLIYNDLDSRVVNFWNCLKEDYHGLCCRCNQLNNIIQSSYFDADKVNKLDEWETSEDLFKQAAAEFIYRQYLTINGLSWTFKQDVADKFDFYLFKEALLRINISNKSYNEIIQELDTKDTFYLIDPPYDIKRVSRYYRVSDKFDHEKLRDTIKEIEGNWLLTYNDNRKIRNLYKDYNISKNTRKLFGKSYTELYITKDK